MSLNKISIYIETTQEILDNSQLGSNLVLTWEIIIPNCWGKFFPFVFRFLTFLLSCILLLFALRYFVNYAPLIRAVCKFRYSLLSRPYLLPVFFVSIDVTSFVEIDYLFPRWP